MLHKNRHVPQYVTVFFVPYFLSPYMANMTDYFVFLFFIADQAE